MKWEIKILCLTAMITSISYSIVNAFFSPILVSKQVPETILGMIISIYSIVALIFTPFLSHFTEIFGRKNLFMKSLLFNVFLLIYLFR